MGLKVSKPKPALTNAELQVFAEETHFSVEQVQRIHDQFTRISKSCEDDGVIDLAEFCSAMGMDANELSRQIFRVFDTNGDGVLNFREFLGGLSVLSFGNQQEKLHYAFKMYDIDRDGRISREELRGLFAACMSSAQGPNGLPPMDDAVVGQLIEETFKDADTDGNGYIDFAEFEALAARQPGIVSSLQLNAQKIAKVAGPREQLPPMGLAASGYSSQGDRSLAHSQTAPQPGGGVTPHGHLHQSQVGGPQSTSPQIPTFQRAARSNVR